MSEFLKCQANECVRLYVKQSDDPRCPRCVTEDRPLKALTDERAIAEMATWLEPGRELRLYRRTFVGGGVQVKCLSYRSGEPCESSADAPTIGEAWAALKAQEGFPK